MSTRTEALLVGYCYRGEPICCALRSYRGQSYASTLNFIWLQMLKESVVTDLLSESHIAKTRVRAERKPVPSNQML